MITIPEPGGKPEIEDAGSEPDRFRLLVVAAESVPAAAIEREIRRHAGEREPEVWICAPAIVETPFQHAAGDVDEGIEEAGRRLEASLEAAREAGVPATGAVGDSDPLLSIEDALARAPADEVLIVTHESERAGWMEKDLFERAKEKLEPPLTHVIVPAEGETSVEERAGAGTEGPEREVESGSSNTPKYSARDLLGIAVALIGTVILFAVAGTCADENTAGGLATHCVVELLIAGAMGLINVAHVVGLVLFSSVGYRGPWEKFFAWLSLVGTPTAVVAVVIISVAA